MSRKKFLYTFFHSRMIAVFSTIGPNTIPEAAVMEFGDTPNLELIFGTLRTTRKYQNLKRNPHIACVIGWEAGETVQYEGIAEELEGELRERYTRMMFAKNTAFKHWEHMSSMTYFRVLPCWIRYSCMHTKPWIIRSENL